MSTSKSKQKSSSTTLPSSTLSNEQSEGGQQAFVTGFLMPDPQDKRLNPLWMGSAKEMLSESAKQWIVATATMTAPDMKAALTSELLEAALPIIDQAIVDLDNHAVAISDKEIIKAMAGLAQTFQVSIPEDGGIEIYISSLRDIPRPAFMEAVKSLVREHKWPRLPYPADFISKAEPEETRLLLVNRYLVNSRRRVIEALQSEGKDNDKFGNNTHQSQRRIRRE
jgi:hypothetical protein